MDNTTDGLSFGTTNGILTSPLSFSSSLVVIAITFFCLIWYQKQKKPVLPPGPKPWPVIGCLIEMFKSKPVFRWIDNLMHDLGTEIACIRLGNVNVIAVSSPEISLEFLKTQDAVFASRPISMSTRFTTKGYLTAALVPFGVQWKKMRKVLTADLLAPAKHKLLLGKRIEEADHLVRYICNQCKNSDEGGLVNLRVATQHYTANLTRKLIFNKRFFGEGSKDGGPGIEEVEHVNAVFTILSYIYSFCVSDYLPYFTGLDLDGQEKIIKQANRTASKYQDPIIEERIQQWKNGTKNEVEDWLDVLIILKDNNGNPLLSTDEIKAQITEIMIEAVDNPSNAAEWAIAEMINQPQLLEKAVEELDRVVGKERLVQESDFSKLNYIKACAREAFRLHPIAPFNVPHIALADATIANYFIPKGSHILISRLGLGRNPRVWDDPLKFNPGRHLEDDGSELVLTDNELRFLSFSIGRRGCVGVTLGSAMTVMLFARLLHGFSWSVPPNESRIDLKESNNSLALAKPLIVLAKPRLPAYVYPA